MDMGDWPVFEDAYELKEWKVEHGYVRCDSVGCEAREDPKTEWEIRQAYGHWRYHHNLGGCSHGR